MDILSLKNRVEQLRVEVEGSAAAHNALFGRFMEAQHLLSQSIEAEAAMVREKFAQENAAQEEAPCEIEHHAIV